MSTLPQLANRWQIGLDALRTLVRTDPALCALGTRVGPVRAFNDVEAEQIRTAHLRRQVRRSGEKAPAAPSAT